MDPEFAFRAADGSYHPSPADARAHNLYWDAASTFLEPQGRGAFSVPPLLAVLRDKQQREKLIALLARHGFVWESA